MAPKTLSSFLSPPFTLPTIPNTKLVNLHNKPPFTLILCRFSQKSPLSETPLSGPKPVPEGTGAAAPTPGDRFLESRRSFEAAKVLLKEKKKKRQKEKPLKVSTAVASCYGCGAPLQTSEPDAPGYSDPDTYALVQVVFNFLLGWNEFCFARNVNKALFGMRILVNAYAFAFVSEMEMCRRRSTTSLELLYVEDASFYLMGT